MNNYDIFEKPIRSDITKIIINLDNELCKGEHPKIIKKVLCIFTDVNDNQLSLSKETTVGFHTLLDIHLHHHHHHHNVYNLGKTKHFFTDKKQEEEGLKKNDFIWILDFGWASNNEHKNEMEFSFHFVKHEQMKMTMLVFYEDEDDNSDFEFGWLQDKLAGIVSTENEIINKYVLRKLIQ